MKQQRKRLDLERNSLVLCGKSTWHPRVMGCPWRGKSGMPRVRVDLVDDVELQPVFTSYSPLSFWSLALRTKIEHSAEFWAHPITGVTFDCRLFPGIRAWILSDLLCKCGGATNCCGPGSALKMEKLLNFRNIRRAWDLEGPVKKELHGHPCN